MRVWHDNSYDIMLNFLKKEEEADRLIFAEVTVSILQELKGTESCQYSLG